MVEVVFSDSEKGSMRYGQSFTNKDSGAIAVTIVRADGKQPTQKEYNATLTEAQRRHEQELRTGKPLGGNPDDVIGLSFALDIGSIAPPATDASRREFIAQMFINPWNELHDMEDSINRYWDGCVSDLNKLMTKAKAGEPVRIWYSEAPYSMCGFYDTIFQLKDCECPISAVKLPAHMPMVGQRVTSAISWGEIHPEELAYYLPLETGIPDAIQKAIIEEWKTLKRENAPLRAVVNGKLRSVGIDFYDGFIRKEIPYGTFKVGQLIGLVLGRYQLGIGDWLIARRIEKMIASGELTVVQKNSAFYGTTLKKAL